MHYLSNYINHYEKSIFIFTESWLTENDDTNFICARILHHTLVRRDRVSKTKKHGGGICLFIPKLVKYSCISTEESLFYDISAVDIFTTKEVIRIISVYAPPDLNTLEFINLLNDIKILADQFKIVIIGDFNRSKIKWTGNEYFAPNSAESYLMEFMNTLDINQIVRQPTRGNHILDLIFIGKKMEYYNIEVLDPPINHKTGKPVSDHRQIRFKTPIKLNIEVLIPKLNYFKSNYPTINWKMNQINWNIILEGLSTEEETAQSYQ